MNDKAIYSILQCAEMADGLLSRRNLTKLLQGQTSRAIKNGLGYIDKFGAIADMSKETYSVILIISMTLLIKGVIKI